MTIYNDLLAAGVELDSHESDLYAVVTPTSTAIVDRYIAAGNRVTGFTALADGRRWYDIPFAFDPFWDQVKAGGIRLADRRASNASTPEGNSIIESARREGKGGYR